MAAERMNELETALLDLHLGRLAPREERSLRERIAADPALARQNAGLASVFAALNSVRAEFAAPEDLAERSAARVAAAGPALRVGASPRPAERFAEPDGGVVLPVRSLRDVLAVAAVLVFAVGVGLPSLLQVRERSLRGLCAANMARLGQGVQAYAATFGNSLPFRGWQRGTDSWQPTTEPGRVTQPNRSHMYLLLSAGYAQPEWFICPSSGGVPMPAEQVRQRSDFLDASNVSLAFQNMAGARPTVDDAPDIPIFSDDNPLFDNGRPLFNAIERLQLTDPAHANSRAHAGRGQNILTLDGRTIWTTTPACGVNGDNIWTLSGVQQYTGGEGPTVKTDSHLLK